ncbi:phospholipase B1, membrane-associated-like [Ischnura elegans]|uniref:phospholipase B1, membrane-associated-like n=1 Tax=Ischnura elegans TaxID=197161 RepID=UPI001ED880D0|nr:phospholipase B1, membrane-associated-like [Ischnura elegans]
MPDARSSTLRRWRVARIPLFFTLFFTCVHPGYAARNGGVFGVIGEVAGMDQIMKEVQSITYPPDSYWNTVQATIPDSEPFPCVESVPWRSADRPDSVHRLRPGDIDVVGAMGDSLICGNGAREFSPLGMPVQDRGVSYTGGGLSDWRHVVTLPNILKEFNPRLVGFSKGRGDFLSYNAQLNVAIPAALDDDAIDQAKLFVRKMLSNPAVNFTHDWKILSISLGHNDLCSYQCFYKKQNTPEEHKMQLQKALDYLYTKVPRLFVNLISILDTTMTVRMPRNNFCRFFNRVACPCLFQEVTMKKSLMEMAQLVRKYQQKEQELASNQRYTGREDFTVEWQPFFHFTNYLKDSGEIEDGTNLFKAMTRNPVNTPDCVHFNQRGMAIMSTLLWRNMLEPVGNKTRRFQQTSYKDFVCPTEKAPYLFTKENSKRYLESGHQ